MKHQEGAGLTAFHIAAEMLARIRRVRDAEGGVWSRIDDSDYFMPDFAGGNMTLAEIIDHFGDVTEVAE